jgi:hypothetical protein
MIDEDVKLRLVEINVNSALTTNIDTLIQTISLAVKKSIYRIFINFFFLTYLDSSFKLKVISIEYFEKNTHDQKIFLLKNLKWFEFIYNKFKRKGSLLYTEQKGATSSFQKIRKVNPSIRLLTHSNNNNSLKWNKKSVVSY